MTGGARFRRSARPMFCMISTWEPQVSAKRMASTPRSPVMSTPSPRTRPEARKALCTRWPAASMPLANCRSTSRRSATRRSPHSHAHHTLGQVVVGGVDDVQLRGRLRQVLREGGGIGAAFSTFWSKVMTVCRLYAAACSRRARRRPRSAPSESPAAGPGRPQPTHHRGGRRPSRLRHRLLRSRECGPCQPGRAARHDGGAGARRHRAGLHRPLHPGAPGLPGPADGGRRRQRQHHHHSNAELEEKAALLASQNREIETKNLDVEQARKELEARARELARTSRYKSEFPANMSHELRTSLVRRDRPGPVHLPRDRLPARRLPPRPEHPRRGQLFHPVPADRAPRRPGDGGPTGSRRSPDRKSVV